MAVGKQPPISDEAREADWWVQNQDSIGDWFEEAKAAGKLGKGIIAGVIRQKATALTAGKKTAEHE
jgi:hypothetical protein